uniref:Lipoxygenase domain-containing protein n=1 Tax=Magallana gigas TaxID=29159 RepID=A0A8W8JFB5_MAGGI
MIRHFMASKVFKEPKGCEVWRKEEIDGPNQTKTQRAQADHWFAWQRINGLTRNLIRKVQTIPEQFVPFEYIIEENHPYLAGKTLEAHIQQGTLFVVDLWEISLNEQKTIPGYFFKDDALLLHKAIHQFVYEYAAHHYGNDDVNVQQDHEIQSFRQELLLPRRTNGNGGCGMNGISEFTSIENLVEVLTGFIYICSVEHSAANYPAYDQFAFPPNMPDILHGQPEEEMNDLDEAMPTGKELFYIIGAKRTGTQVLTNSLGNYEDSYLKTMDSDGKAFVKKFQQNLLGVTEQINQRNNDITAGNNGKEIKEYPYEWLLPENVLNSINI